jgi:uncharacterized protein (DUF1810 family)
MRRAVESATPRVHKKRSAPTARDYSTSGLGAAAAILVVTALHHGAKVDLSPEVVAALTTIFGFFSARYFRY